MNQLDWKTQAEEHALRVETLHYIMHEDTTRAVARASTPVVRDAIECSMAALQKFGSLSTFLVANSRYMRKVILANNPYLFGCACLVGVEDGLLKWGIDAMLLNFSEALGAAATRLDYLQAVAVFGGEVYLVGVGLSRSEASLFWERLQSSPCPPHTLHVYSSFYADPLDIGSNNLGSELLESVRRNGKIKALTVAYSNLNFVSLPASIPSLQSLSFIGVQVGIKFFEQITEQLQEWTSLLSLSFSHVQLTPKFLEFSLKAGFPTSSRPWQRSFCDFLKLNHPHLKHLALEGFLANQDESHFMEFLKLLETNASLESLSLAHCSFSTAHSDSVDRTSLMASLVDATHKSELLYLNLKGTPFANDPAIEAQLGKKKAKHSQVLRTYDKVPAIAVRLFICGDSYAGKTTLLRNLSNEHRKGFQMKLWQGANNVSSKRTRGIQIRNLVQDGIKVSAWDMAGQDEFHAFHDHMFPNTSSHGAPAIFLFVWSPIDSKNDGMGELKSAEAFAASFRYWLKFIASKTRRSNVARKVMIVLTRKDQMDLVKDSICTYLSILQDTFRMVIEIAGIWEVDARNPTSVKVVASSIFECARSVLKDVMVYKVCNELNTHLNSMASPVLSWKDFQKLCRDRLGIFEIEQQTAIALSLHDSGQLIYFSSMPFVILDTNWFCCKVMGELIHFSGPPVRAIPFSGFVPQQYLEKILGQGALSSLNISAAHLVDLMEAMHLCCKVPGDAHSNVFIPSTLPSWGVGARTLCWRTNTKDKGANYYHIGRRLQCRDKVVTFLTPGLFPVIQVSFKKAFGKLGGDVVLHKHLISIYYQCMEIIVEFCKSNGENVMDILVRSSNEVDLTVTLKVMEEKVLRTIVRICAEPIGNQGIELIVGIIRPECLILPALAHERDDQYILVEQLKKGLQQQLQERPLQATYWHTWKHNRYFGAGADSIMDLLGIDEYWDVVKTYKSILQEVAKEMETSCGHEKILIQERSNVNDVMMLERSNVNDIMMREAALEMVADSNCPTGKLREGLEEGEDVVTLCEGMAESILREINEVNSKMSSSNLRVHELHSKMDDMHMKLDKVGRVMDTLQGEIQSLATLQGRILPQIQRSLNQLLFFGEEKVVGRVPRMGFLTTEGVGFRKKFVTVPSQQLKSVRIELFCEHKECPHKVDGHINGICLTTINEGALKKALPYANGFLKLLTMIARVGAHVVAGVGSSVPDFSKIVALLLDTPGLLDSFGNMSALTDVSSSFNGWQQWLVHILELNGGMTEHNIYSKFKLRRALYREISHVAWLCELHYNSQTPFPLT